MGTYYGTTAGNVWTTWTADSTASTTNSATWNNWVSTASYCSTTYSSNTARVWGGWVSADNGTATMSPYIVPKQTAEEVAEAKRRNDEAVAKAKIEAEKRLEAQKKAETLLFEMLDEGQKAMVAKDGSFIVMGKSGAKYRIKTKSGISGNIERLGDKEAIIERWCVQCDDWQVPHHDHFTAQKLALEADDLSLRKIANVSQVRA